MVHHCSLWTEEHTNTHKSWISKRCAASNCRGFNRWDLWPCCMHLCSYELVSANSTDILPSFNITDICLFSSLKVHVVFYYILQVEVFYVTVHINPCCRVGSLKLAMVRCRVLSHSRLPPLLHPSWSRWLVDDSAAEHNEESCSC